MKFIDFEFKLIQIQLERNKIHDGARGIQVFFMNMMLKKNISKKRRFEKKHFFIPLYLFGNWLNEF
jgi:hypothetical protein